MNDPNIDFDGVFKAVGTDPVTFIASLFGSIISLRFMSKDSSWTQRVLLVFGGLGTSLYMAPLIIDWFSVKGDKGAIGIIFLTGVFGMSILDTVFERTRSGEWLDFVSTAIKRRLFP